MLRRSLAIASSFTVQPHYHRLPARCLLPAVQAVRLAHNGSWDPYHLRPNKKANDKSVRKLLGAIRRRNQDATWDAYVALSDSNSLMHMPAEYHSSALRTFRLKNLVAYGPEEIQVTKQRLEFVVETMKKFNCKLDIRDYNHLLEVFGRAGDWEQCTHFWNDLKKTSSKQPSLWGLEPDIYSYNLYMRAAIQSKKPALVFDILAEMKAANIEPNDFTFNTLIEANGYLGNLKDADKVFEKAFVKAKQSSVSRVASLLQLTKTHSATSASSSTNSLAAQIAPLTSLRQSEQTALRPTAETFTALIDAHGRQGNLRGLTHIYQNMLSKFKVKPDIDIYNALIRWHCHHDDVETTRTLFFDMEKSGVKPNVVTFNYLFRHQILKRRSPKAAEMLIDFMKQMHDLQPLQSMYRALIKIHNKHNREDEANRLYRDYLALKESQR